MWDVLLQNLPTILLVVLAGIICGAELIKAIQVWREERDRRNGIRQEEQNRDNSIQETLQLILTRLDTMDLRLENLESRLENTERRLTDLTESDMHDIKAWIVEQYHKFYTNQGWIDAFSAETIDKRYEDYVKEGGNSYVENLITQLHTLSMDPEQSRHKKR